MLTGSEDQSVYVLQIDEIPTGAAAAPFVDPRKEIKRKKKLQGQFKKLVQDALDMESVPQFSLTKWPEEVYETFVPDDKKIKELHAFLLLNLGDLNLVEPGVNHCPTLFHNLILLAALIPYQFVLPDPLLFLPKMPWNQAYGPIFTKKWAKVFKSHSAEMFEQITPFWLWENKHCRSNEMNFHTLKEMAALHKLDFNVGKGKLSILYSLANKSAYIAGRQHWFLEELLLAPSVPLKKCPLPETPDDFAPDDLVRYQFCVAFSRVMGLLQQSAPVEEKKGDEANEYINPNAFDEWIDPVIQLQEGAQKAGLSSAAIYVADLFLKRIAQLEKASPNLAQLNSYFLKYANFVKKVDPRDKHYCELQIALLTRFLSPELPYIMMMPEDERFQQAFEILSESSEYFPVDRAIVQRVSDWKLKQPHPPIRDISFEASMVLLHGRNKPQILNYLFALQQERQQSARKVADLTSELDRMRVQFGSPVAKP
jgi:hypothetical protein